MSEFDKLARDYDDFFKTSMGEYVDQVEKDLIFELMGKIDGRALELGCGTGNLSLDLASRGFELTAIDRSKEMLALAKDKGLREGLDIDYREMDAEKLDFEDESFDLVISLTAFEFFKDQKAAFEEMKRVLRPGGSLIIGTINRESDWGDLYAMEAIKEDSIFREAKFTSEKELSELWPEKLVALGEALFIPPLIEEEDYNIENEEKLAANTNNRGGFLAVKWVK